MVNLLLFANFAEEIEKLEEFYNFLHFKPLRTPFPDNQLLLESGFTQ